jgi:type VI secretion system protein ImpJ
MSERPVWSEGLFLRPQHFQLAERGAASALHARLDGALAYPWGIVELKLSEDHAQGAQVAIERLVAVLPDGEMIRIPADAPPPPPFNVDSQVRGGIVYLTLPADQAGAVAFAYPEAPEAGIARFHVVEQDGRIVWDESYIPPVLDIRASGALSGFLVDIMGRLDSRQDELSLRAVEGAEGGTETFAAYLLLQLLNRWQPELRHLSRLDRVHPERLFTAFLGFAGELATFTRADRRPTGFPDYDHENLELCFRPVVEAIRAGLSTEFSRSAVQLELKLLQPGAYASTITDRSLYDQGRFYLAVSTRRPADQVRQSMPSVVKIGSVAKMQQLVQSALPGVPLTPVGAPPPQIRVMPNYIYFELDRSSPDWRDFATAPALGLHVAGDWPELDLELWCVKRQAR